MTGLTAKLKERATSELCHQPVAGSKRISERVRWAPHLLGSGYGLLRAITGIVSEMNFAARAFSAT
jgi:hypothetical protein